MSNEISDFLLRANIRLTEFSTMAIIERRELTREPFNDCVIVRPFQTATLEDNSEGELNRIGCINERG